MGNDLFGKSGGQGYLVFTKDALYAVPERVFKQQHLVTKDIAQVFQLHPDRNEDLELASKPPTEGGDGTVIFHTQRGPVRFQFYDNPLNMRQSRKLLKYSMK